MMTGVTARFQDICCLMCVFYIDSYIDNCVDDCVDNYIDNYRRHLPCFTIE